MTCAQAAPLLAAYRRDDWAPRELDALGRHLADCPACRQNEATYRDVGFGVRELASITPPESFRARVFAAIEAEKAAMAGRPPVATAMVAVAEAPAFAATGDMQDTQPRLPVIRIRSTQVRRPVLPQRNIWQRAGLGLAAALLLSVVGARFIPLMEPGLANLAQSLLNATSQQQHHTPAPHQPASPNTGPTR
jgi:hypothetical protein